MKIAVAGASGFIGSRLCKEFLAKGWEVIGIKRSELYAADGRLTDVLKDVNVVINLAGAPITQRWTKSTMEKIYESRVTTTRNLVSAIHHLEMQPQLFISISATGIYENGGPYTESNSLLSSSFLGKLCQDWEKEAYLAEDSCRVVIFRLGVVLDTQGGALPRMLPIFKAGLGGRIGKGTQHFPWVCMTDVIRAFFLAIENKKLKGVFNLTAPQIVDNKQFTKALSEVLHRPALIPVPASLLFLLFGKGSSALTEGQAVIPQRLLDTGFSFHFPQLTLALRYLLKK